MCCELWHQDAPQNGKDHKQSGNGEEVDLPAEIFDEEPREQVIDHTANSADGVEKDSTAGEIRLFKRFCKDLHQSAKKCCLHATVDAPKDRHENEGACGRQECIGNRNGKKLDRDHFQRRDLFHNQCADALTDGVTKCESGRDHARCGSGNPRFFYDSDEIGAVIRATEVGNDIGEPCEKNDKHGSAPLLYVVHEVLQGCKLLFTYHYTPRNGKVNFRS